jgi:hypothetical protein
MGARGRGWGRGVWGSEGSAMPSHLFPAHTWHTRARQTHTRQGWFTYRNLAFKPDREELLRSIDAYIAKVLGK